MDTVTEQLQRQLAERQREKAELERRVRGLQAQYRDEIASLEEQVLRLRVERLRRAAQRHMRSARHRNAYHDAQQAYEEFREAQIASSASSDDLHASFRQASKHCHPDVVPEAYRAQAAMTFQALEAAHQAGHAAAVEAIADALDEWGFPGRSSLETSNGPSPSQLREAVASLEASIQSLRASDAYRMVEERGGIDAAIEVRKREVARQLRQMKREGGENRRRWS